MLVYIGKCKVYADFEVFVLYRCYIYFKENTYYLVVIHDTFFNMTLRALYKLLIRNIMYSTVFSGVFFIHYVSQKLLIYYLYYYGTFLLTIVRTDFYLESA